MIDILNELKSDHTIILITHKPELMHIADRVVVLRDGHVSAKGTNQDVYERSTLYRELLEQTFARPSIVEE